MQHTERRAIIEVREVRRRHLVLQKDEHFLHFRCVPINGAVGYFSYYDIFFPLKSISYRKQYYIIT